MIIASGMLSIGDVGELSPYASGILRVSTINVWADLETATARRQYLRHVVEAHHGVPFSLWIVSLRERECSSGL